MVFSMAALALEAAAFALAVALFVQGIQDFGQAPQCIDCLLNSFSA
jgi:hypothetical protein